MGKTILSEILLHKEREVRDRKVRIPQEDLVAKVHPRDEDRFLTLFTTATSILLIAEVKKASPSKGIIREDFDHITLAKAYTEAGANAISVLTDEYYFQGALSFLSEIRAVTPLPLLRKDFIIDEYQIYEAAYAGADTFLLIAAALDDAQLSRFITLGISLAMTPLVEVHSKEELLRVLDTPARVIGINNRDLRTFTVSLETTYALLPRIPADRFVVSESGINTRDDVVALERAGVSGVLVGEGIVKHHDVKERIWHLLGTRS